MGFFQSLGRMINGQPVFQSGDNTDAPTASKKVFPVVVINRTECRASGQSMELDVDIQNNSVGEIMLDKIILFGQKHEIDTELATGEKREFTVFRGPRPASASDQPCELQYRDATGDYFSSRHILSCEKLSDGLVWVKGVKFLPPVRDI